VLPVVIARALTPKWGVEIREEFCLVNSSAMDIKWRTGLMVQSENLT